MEFRHRSGSTSARRAPTCSGAGAGNVNSFRRAWLRSTCSGRAEFWNDTVPNPFQGLITDPNSSLRFRNHLPQSADACRSRSTGRSARQLAAVGELVLPRPAARFEKRLSAGLQFLTTYVFSKSIDDTSSSGSNTDWLGAMSTSRSGSVQPARAGDLALRPDPSVPVQLGVRSAVRQGPAVGR